MAPIPRALDPPSDWTDHGVSGLVCTPADWQTVANFFIVNYLAHCLTVKQYPADTAKEVLITMFMALFLPSSGIARAIDSIIRHPRLRTLTELERACTAGALCIVVRKRSWKPMNDNILRNLSFDHNVSYMACNNCLETIPNASPFGYYIRNLMHYLEVKREVQPEFLNSKAKK